MLADHSSQKSLIIEILKYEEEITDDKAMAHFFNDLAQFNEVYKRSSLNTFPLFLCYTLNLIVYYTVLYRQLIHQSSIKKLQKVSHSYPTYPLSIYEEC